MKKIFLEMYLENNLGDDIFLYIFAKRYLNVQFYVNAPMRNINELGLDNVHPYSFVDRVLNKINLKLFSKKISKNKYDARIVVGGSMFMEKKLSEKELHKLLNIKYSRLVPMFFIGENFGPYKNTFYLQEYKKIFQRAEDVCFRDEYSAKLFSGLPNVRVAPDIVFGLDRSEYLCRQSRRVIISVINLDDRDGLSKCRAAYEKKILEVAEHFSNINYEVILMSFCEAEGDKIAIQRILSKTSSNVNISAYFYKGDLKEAIEYISTSECVIGSRFHSIVLGMVFGKKTLPIAYSDKTKNMLEDIGCSSRSFDIKEIRKMDVSKIDSYFVKLDDVSRLSEESKKHFEKLDEFLEEGG